MSMNNVHSAQTNTKRGHLFSLAICFDECLQWSERLANLKGNVMNTVHIGSSFIIIF